MPGKLDPKQYENLGRQVEVALVRDYGELLHKPHRRWAHSFVAGLFAGFGGVIGATVMVALLLFLLQYLGALPWIGEYFQSLSQTIKR